MPVPGHHLAALAVAANLPAAGADALATCGNPLTRRLLARRPDLPERVRSRLLDDVDRPTRRYAAAAVTDPDLIRRLLRVQSNSVRAGLAANPHTPTTVLDHYVTTGKPDTTSSSAMASISRAALANRSTSTDVVLDRVRDAELRHVIGTGQEATRAMTAARILDAHPQVARLWADAQDGAVVRAVALRPDIELDVAERLTDPRRTLVPPAVVGNPFVPTELLRGRSAAARSRLGATLAGADPRALCADPAQQLRMVAAGSATLDVLVARSAPAWEVAAALLTRPRPAVEPFVVAQLLRSANLDQALFAVETNSATRMAAAAVAAPVLSLACEVRPPQMMPQAATLERVCADLGEDPARWVMFTELAQRTRARLEDLVTVAAGTAA